MIHWCLMIFLFQIFKLIVHKFFQVDLSQICRFTIQHVWRNYLFKWVLKILAKLILSEWLVNLYFLSNFMNLFLFWFEAVSEIYWLDRFTVFIYFLQILLESWLVHILRFPILSFRWLLPLCRHLSDIDICV